MDSSDSDDSSTPIHIRVVQNIELKRMKLQEDRRQALEKAFSSLPPTETIELESDLEEIELGIDEPASCEKLKKTTELQCDLEEVELGKHKPDSRGMGHPTTATSKKDLPVSSNTGRNLRRSKRINYSETKIAESVEMSFGRMQTGKSKKVKRSSDRKKKNTKRRSNVEDQAVTAHDDNRSRHNNTVDKDQAVVIFDDDTEFPKNSKPIDFNFLYNRKSIESGLVESPISQTDLPTNKEDTDEEEWLENENVTLSISWFNGKGTQNKVFTLRRYQKFETVYEELAKVEGLPVSRVVLLRNFNPISPMDTPSTLNLSLYAGLTGFITNKDVTHNMPRFNSSKEEMTSKTDSGISVKLQLESNQTLFFTIKKNQKMSVLYNKCCEELKCDDSKIKITFDGEYLQPSDCLSDLGVEDDDVFHVHIKS